MGTFPRASCVGSDCNADVSVGFTEEQQRGGIETPCRREKPFRPQPPATGRVATPHAASTGSGAPSSGSTVRRKAAHRDGSMVAPARRRRRPRRRIV